MAHRPIRIAWYRPYLIGRNWPNFSLVTKILSDQILWWKWSFYPYFWKHHKNTNYVECNFAQKKMSGQNIWSDKIDQILAWWPKFCPTKFRKGPVGTMYGLWVCVCVCAIIGRIIKFKFSKLKIFILPRTKRQAGWPTSDPPTHVRQFDALCGNMNMDGVPNNRSIIPIVLRREFELVILIKTILITTIRCK